MEILLICIIAAAVLLFVLALAAAFITIVATINNDYDDPHEITFPRGPSLKNDIKNKANRL